VIYTWNSAVRGYLNGVSCVPLDGGARLVDSVNGGLRLIGSEGGTWMDVTQNHKQ
jgi:hypothetical protein